MALPCVFVTIRHFQKSHVFFMGPRIIVYWLFSDLGPTFAHDSSIERKTFFKKNMLDPHFSPRWYFKDFWLFS